MTSCSQPNMADCDSYASETLFSLEVLVEYIRIHKPGIVKKGFEPAVGVRFLDFPTLVIYRGEQEDFRCQEDSDSEKENAATHNISKGDALLQQPVDDSTEYPFRKGKSCLFKINLDLLHMHLSNVPLYVMVLDSRNEIPKLLGSSMVSLAKTIDIIKTDVKQLGICTPFAQGEKGLFGLYNLMGEKIGCISLGYKLLSLGASLIPHIPESRVLHLGSSKTPVKQLLKASDNIPETKTKQVIPQPGSSNVLCQNIELDGKQTDVVVSETEAKRAQMGISTGTQTEPERRPVKSIEVEQSDFDKEGSLNVYCPPPLYYSRLVGRPEEEEEGGADRYSLVKVAMEELRVEDLHAEEDDEEQFLPAEWRSVALQEEVQRRRGRAADQSQTPPALLGEALRQLPLLSALLRELSQLNGPPPELPVPAPTGQAAAHPPKAHPRSCCASPTSRGGRLPSPQPRRSQVAQPKRSQVAQPKRLGPANQDEPPKSPSKRKLVHGLTRTVRLRLLQRNPEVLKEQEQREVAWRSRTAALKMATRGLRRPGSGIAAKPGQKRLPCSPRGLAVDRSSKLDENVQTLVSSVDVDSARVGPSQTGDSRRGGDWRTGSHDNGGAVSFGQNRAVQVRIPSALSQRSDRSDASEPRPPPPPNNKAGFRGGSAGSSLFSSPVPLRSESCQGSPGFDGEYLDDFTSLEPTEGFSPDPPERKQTSRSDSDSQERRRAQTSRSDSDSQERRRAQTSRSDSDSQERRRAQTSRSDSDSQERRRPAVSFPVKSNGSPQRSLKGTHVIRPRTQASVSLSSDSELAAASVCSGTPRHRRSRVVDGASRGPSVCQDSGGSGARQSERQLNDPSARASPPDLRILSNDSSLDSIISPPPGHRDGEMMDELGSLGFSHKCHHISELVLNKLPGYTL